jgi:hypothetical protein
MSRRQQENKLPLSQVIGEWEKRVSQQKLLIAELKVRGKSIQGAEADLRRYEASLYQLRNHCETMQELMTPGRGRKPISEM